jgi:DNA-binding transcriptional LysR family regulator
MADISYGYDKMDLEQLETLIVVAEAGSLSAAAGVRNLSQPAVSLQIKALEEDLGTPLFHRGRRGVTPTEAGTVLLDHARRVHQQVRLARAEVAEIRGMVRGSVRLGATDAAATEILPGAFVEFHRRHPGIEVAVEVAGTGELLEELRRGDLDLVLGTLPVQGDDIRSEPLVSELLRLVVPGKERRTPILSLLEREPFIAYPRGSTTRRLVDEALASAGWPVRPLMEIGRPRVMARLVEAGLGVSVLPEGVNEEAVSRGVVHRVSRRRLQVKRDLGLIGLRTRDLEPAARALAQVVRDGVMTPGARADRSPPDGKRV